ncbi:MAG: hypothetical protein LBI99_10200 [Propionibacteriaceae bacterium]|jgi:antitoxin (DNA-binding transcriptional repressor) of toxin-antitoxin stability system|nr:hypothetical protein [Propionibacteriaceae bacterium]
MSTLIIPENTISVGALRQNPAPMVHQVRLGAEYVLTDRGVPTARIVPFAQHWIPASQVRDVLNTPTDPTWAEDLSAARSAEAAKDPWER